MVLYDWSKIKIEYQEGKALNAISKAHGCNRAAIRKHAENGGWQRPDPLDIYKATILSKATHEEMFEFNLTYQKCYKSKIDGRKYYSKAQPYIKKLKLQNQCLKKKNQEIHRTKKTPFLSSCMNAFISLKNQFSFLIQSLKNTTS